MTLLARMREPLRPPQWVPIGLSLPQDLVRVMLITRTQRLDVTRQNVLAALAPLTIALPASHELGAALDTDTPLLEFVDESSNRVLGRLRLKRSEAPRLASTEAIVFHVTSGTDRCQPWPQRTLGQIARRVRARRAPGPAAGLQMSQAAIEHMHIFYICPRPVMLISAWDGREGNLFPMDLIGPFGEGRFTLALRNTSPSVATMKRTRTIVLSDISPADCATAYRLGAHHKTAAIDWHALPFPVHRTKRSNIPHPAIALRVRELELLDHATTGSHTLFVAEITADYPASAGPRLFHTTSSHQRYRSSRGQPLQSASPDAR
jgi:hypothetical protein